MHRIGLLPLTVLALALPACGDDDDKESGSRADTAAADSGQVHNSTATHTAQDVINALDLQVDEDNDGISDRPATPQDIGTVTTGPVGRVECRVHAILIGKGAIETYLSGGSTVVTNRAGNAGVKFGDEPGCGDKLAEGLKALK